MTTENWSEENVYIKELYVNGKKYDKSYLTYEDVSLAGITLCDERQAELQACCFGGRPSRLVVVTGQNDVLPDI